MLQGLYAAIDRDSRSSTPSMDVILRLEVYALSSKTIEQRSLASERSQPVSIIVVRSLLEQLFQSLFGLIRSTSKA